jgi:hypothetical protein
MMSGFFHMSASLLPDTGTHRMLIDEPQRKHRDFLTVQNLKHLALLFTPTYLVGGDLACPERFWFGGGFNFVSEFGF